MEPKWINNGEPDENGDIVAVIENPNGTRVSTFKGKTVFEVANKALSSMAEANRTIGRLMRPPDAGRKPFKAERKELTATDKLRLAGEMTDPERVVEAVTEIVTARTGVTPDALGERLEEMDEPARAAYYQREARAFVNDHPDYYPDDKQINMKTLFGELSARGIDMTRNNLDIVYQSLLAQGKMLPWPGGDDDEEEEEPQLVGVAATPTPAKPNGSSEPNPPRPMSTPRPRSISSGIRSSDANASPLPPARKPKITRADIERMSRQEFMDRLRDPEFKRQVDALGA
jgi:hypothetical protein